MSVDNFAGMANMVFLLAVCAMLCRALAKWLPHPALTRICTGSTPVRPAQHGAGKTNGTGNCPFHTIFARRGVKHADGQLP